MKRFLALVLVLQFVEPRFAAALQFQGVNHSPLGNAQLSLQDGKLVVSNIGSSGDDGVSVAIPGGAIPGGSLSRWHGVRDPIDIAIGDYEEWRTLRNGVLMSTATTTRLPGGTYRIAMNASSFNSSTQLKVEAYRHGQLVRTHVIDPPDPLPGPQPAWLAILVEVAIIIILNTSYKSTTVETYSEPDHILIGSTTTTTWDWNALAPTTGTISGDPLGPVTFDLLEVTPISTTLMDERPTEVQLVGSNLPTLSFTKSAASTAVPGVPRWAIPVVFLMLAVVGLGWLRQRRLQPV